MSNWEEPQYTKDGFKVGLYSYSMKEGLCYRGTLLTQAQKDVIYLVPSRLKEIMQNPHPYLDKEDDTLYVWLNDPL